MKTSSNKLFFNRRLIHKPDANRQKKPLIKVVTYNTAHTPDDALMDNNHQFKKKYGARYGCNNYLPSCDFMLLYPLVTHTGQTEEEGTEQLCIKQGRKQSGGTLEIK